MDRRDPAAFNSASLGAMRCRYERNDADTEETLPKKLSKLLLVRQAAQWRLCGASQRGPGGNSKETDVETNIGPGTGQADGWIELEPKFPVEAVKLTASFRYMCLCLGQQPTEADTGMHCLHLILLQICTVNLQQPPSLVGWTPAFTESPQGQALPNLDGCFEVLETRCGPMVALCGGISVSQQSSQPWQHTVTILAPKDQRLQARTILEADGGVLWCLKCSDEDLYAAGDDGQGQIWHVSKDWKTSRSKLPLQQARCHGYALDIIVMLRVAEVDNGTLLVGLSSLGSLAVWNSQSGCLLTAVHHATCHVRDLQVVDAPRLAARNRRSRGSDADDHALDAQPLVLVAIITRHSAPSQGPRLAAALLRHGILDVGEPFALQGVCQMDVSQDNGLVTDSHGRMHVWNIAKGCTVWTSECLPDSRMTAAKLSAEHGIAVAATADGRISLHRWLKE
ncbi:unnamed protein product [Ostreobium quekettii]|uniref:Uncharacterized protein n=1 Tax=Ostreobium quekettii TaxID=121088 RepID=A0A8S1IW83_9CHLO|nr:unnamed protein product [Ostreobium quekettii]|eukprot:evm.model.scf_156.4 EVM.evm.TU.scf_156.4   scf_156:35941-42825(+)